jgi:hypothetical protein
MKSAKNAETATPNRSSPTKLTLQKIIFHAYPHETGSEAEKIRLYDGFQYVVTSLTGFVPFSSNLLKNQKIFLFLLKQPDRHRFFLFKILKILPITKTRENEILQKI